MAQFNIQLSEDEIERLINGQTVSIPASFKNGKTHIKQINIMQSPFKDTVMPSVNRKNKVVSQAEIDIIKMVAKSTARQSMNENTFNLGV